MLVILSPELDLTNSLLMKSPVGNVILRPLGAVSSTFRSAMLSNIGRVVENSRTARYLQGFKEVDLKERNNDPADDFNM
jgi:hypothetical protein